MDEKICRICGGSFKSLEMHLTACLKKNNMVREQYDLLESKNAEVLVGDESTDVEPSNTVSKVQQTQNIFNVDQSKYDLSKTIKDVIDEYAITAEEFFTVMKQWKTGATIPLKLRLNRKMEIGRDIADQHKDESNVEVSNLEAAEILVKDYGFKCTDVVSAKGVKPKTWVLVKK